jgi:hypothetical protein
MANNFTSDVLQRPDLIRIDLFLLDPNDDSVTASVDELHRVRLFSGRLEVSKAFSSEHLLDSNTMSEQSESTAQALQSSFGTSTGISVTEFLHEIPLFVASPNKADPRSLMPPPPSQPRPPRSPYVPPKSGNVQSPTATSPKKPVMVGRVTLRLELVLEACLGHPISKLPHVKNDEQEEHDDEEIVEENEPARDFVSSVMDNFQSFPTADSVYQSAQVYADIEAMDSTSSLDCLEHCVYRLRAMQELQLQASNTVNRKLLENMGRLFRLSELLFFRLSADKELIDNVALVATVDKLETTGSYALLWEYFQFWLTTPLSKILIGSGDSATDWQSLELQTQDWRSIQTACYSLRLLHYLISSKLSKSVSGGGGSDELFSDADSNAEICKSFSMMAKELLRSLYHYGEQKVLYMQNQSTQTYEAAYPIIMATTSAHDKAHSSNDTQLQSRNKLEVEYCKVIDSEQDAFADAGHVVTGRLAAANLHHDSSHRAGGFASVVTAKLMATKMVKQQRNKKGLKYYGDLSEKLKGSVVLVKSLLDQVLCSTSLLLAVTTGPPSTQPVTPTGGTAMTPATPSTPSYSDFPMDVFASFVKSSITLYGDCLTHIVPPKALAKDFEEGELGAPEYFETRDLTQESLTLLLSYCNHMLLSCPFVFESLDKSREFLQIPVPRKKWAKGSTHPTAAELGAVGVNAVAVINNLVGFTRSHLLYAGSMSSPYQSFSDERKSSQYECQMQHLRASLQSLMGNIIRLFTDALAGYELGVPEPEVHEEIVYLPPSSSKRKKNVTLNSETVRTPHNLATSRAEVNVDAGLQHSFAMLSTMGSTFGGPAAAPAPLTNTFVGDADMPIPPHSPFAMRGLQASTPAAQTLASTQLSQAVRTPMTQAAKSGAAPSAGSSASGGALAYLRSLQTEPEKPPEAVMTRVRGGENGGDDAIVFLGRKFEMLQALQYCLDTFVLISKRITNFGAGARAEENILEGNKLSLYMLNVCRNFIHEIVMNAVLKGSHKNDESFRVRTVCSKVTATGRIFTF